MKYMEFFATCVSRSPNRSVVTNTVCKITRLSSGPFFLMEDTAWLNIGRMNVKCSNCLKYFVTINYYPKIFFK